MQKTICLSPKPITYFPVYTKNKHKFYGWLPNHLKFPFEYSFFLHDQIASIIVNGEEGDQFSHKIKVKKLPKKLEDEHIMDWLENNGYASDACSISYKISVLALLSDMMIFIYESLSCARKLKTTVAYSLLRKPLKDNLYYLELMLADPAEFIRQFNIRKNESITPVERISKEKKIELISKTLAHYKNPFFYTPQYIWNIRYDKSCLFGLEYLFQKSHHLVTNFEQYRTEPCNFNFIFSNNHTGDTLLAYFSSLPILLLHTLHVALELIGSFSPFIEGTVSKSLDARNRLGFILWYKSMEGLDFFDASNFKLSDDLLTSIFPSEILFCKNCGEKLRPSLSLMKRFFRNAHVKCFKCKKISSADQYYK